jgi:hypothetical protein
MLTGGSGPPDFGLCGWNSVCLSPETSTRILKTKDQKLSAAQSSMSV